MRRSLRTIVVSLVAAACASTAHGQETESQYVRTYERMSVVTITGSLAAGTLSLVRPGPMPQFGAFTLALLEYGMFLTGMRTESVPRGLSIAHAAAGVSAAGMAWAGMIRQRRAKERERREDDQETRVRLVPSFSSEQGAGVGVFLRF